MRESKAIQKDKLFHGETRSAKKKLELEKKEFNRRRDMLMTSCLTNQKKDVMDDEEFNRQKLKKKTVEQH